MNASQAVYGRVDKQDACSSPQDSEADYFFCNIPSCFGQHAASGINKT